MSLPAYRQKMENQQIESVSEFSRDNFPLQRIKGIMKSDPDVGMVSTEGKILLSKDFEKFLAHLTNRSWLHTDENKSCTLKRSDIFAEVSCTSTFDFLVNGLHKNESLTANPCSVAMSTPTTAAGVGENETRENVGIRRASEV